MTPTGPTAGQLRDWFLLGSGPLKRTSDRFETVIRSLLAFALLAAIPVALVTAVTASSQIRSRAAEQAQDRHQAVVTLLEDAPAAARDAWGAPRIEAAAGVWTDRAGVAHELTLGVRPGATAGSTVRVWIDRGGTRTGPPISGGSAVGGAIALGFLTWGALSGLAVGAYAAVRVLLERARSRRWAAEWATVEPRWTRRVP